MSTSEGRAAQRGKPTIYDVPVHTRRSALRLAGAGTMGVFAVASTSACTRQPKGPDPLLDQEIRARADAAAATSAIAGSADYAGALRAVAAERTAHADALHAEVARVIGVYHDGTRPPYPAVPLPFVRPGLAIADIRSRITAAQHSAADLGRTQSGYRAGLLGSISAACATQLAVLLK